MELTGIHHVTAITAKTQTNHAFYTGTLGMRLVKKTVNQDDVSAYHLFYADGKGSPGTDLTFFDWPLPPARRGTNSITQIGLRIPSSSLDWWLARFVEQGVVHEQPVEYAGRTTVHFKDPEGQRLQLVCDDGRSNAHPWEKSEVPAEHQLRGLGPVTLSVPELDPTDAVLQGFLNMKPVTEYQVTGGVQAIVYSMGPGGAGAEIHLLAEPGKSRAQSGAGAVHHVALRTPDTEQYNVWHERLKSARVPHSGPVDRFYFQSLYFREPNGILFEIATDGPGFTADEPLESLGAKLSLPPFLEPRRPAIEADLKPL